MNKNEELFEKFFKKQLKEYPLLVEDKDKNNMESAYIAGMLEGCKMINRRYEH